jgi:hypothetical protein
MRKEYDFSKSRKNPYASRLKRQITIRLDADAIDYFKGISDDVGVPYQSLINLYLRDCATAERRPSLSWQSARRTEFTTSKTSSAVAKRAAATSGLNEVLVASIEGRRVLSFDYRGKRRIVEPQCYGIGTKGTELLRAHQLQGGLQREPLFDVAKIKGLVVLDKRFTEPGPDYKRNDSAMTTIFAQL